MVKYDPNAWQTLNKFDNNFSHRADDKPGVGWVPFRENIVNWVFEEKDTFDNFLDTGACLGHFIERLREMGVTNPYQGMDITPNFVDRANEKLPNESFEVGDVRTMKYDDNSYDLVMCCGVLMHLPELSQPMSEVFRVAKKKVLISMFYSPNQTYENHFQNKFLSYYYSREDIVKHFPADWKITRERNFNQPMNLIQFLLEKKE